MSATIMQKGYRVKLDEQKYTIPIERVDFVRAKNAADIMNHVSHVCQKMLPFV